jgi:hypothetical protein
MRLEGTHEHLRDESSTDVFVFSVDPTGPNIPLVAPLTDWIFMEALDAKVAAKAAGRGTERMKTTRLPRKVDERGTTILVPWAAKSRPPR